MRILIQANVSLEYFMLFMIVKELHPNATLDLMVPNSFYSAIPRRHYLKYDNIFTFESEFKRCYKIKNCYGFYKLIKWCNNHKSDYNYVYFGAYRADSTSIFTKYFRNSKNTKIFAIKQTIDRCKQRRIY